jgi:hypothetical protein
MTRVIAYGDLGIIMAMAILHVSDMPWIKQGGGEVVTVVVPDTGPVQAGHGVRRHHMGRGRGMEPDPTASVDNIQREKHNEGRGRLVRLEPIT